MEEQINELVDGDAVMHLELLEYMTDKFRTNHPTVSPDQQKLLALQVLASAGRSTAVHQGSQDNVQG